MIAIDTNVPVPEKRIKWPHADMEVGQSFFIEGRSLMLICNANIRYAKKLGRKFTAKTVDGGIRVWRTA